MACVKPVNWYQRLGHINSEYLVKTVEKQAAYELDGVKEEDSKCKICVQAKMTKNLYPTVEKTERYKPRECLHSDLVS